MRKFIAIMLIPFVLVLAAACAGAEPTATPVPPTPTATATPLPPTPTPTESPMTNSSTAMGPHGDLVLALHQLGGSGQTGIAVLTAQGDKTEVVLMATPGISQANHIHTGGCLELGGIKYPLTDMKDGQSLTLVPATLDSLMTGSFAINLHKAGDLKTYTACADIPKKVNAVTVKLNELNNSGQSGIATLVAQGLKAEVILYATAGLSQANHVHTGDCVTLGGVKYPLNDMKDGWSVTQVAATLADLTAGGMAINLHNAGNAAVYTSCGNIAAMGGMDTGAVTPTTVPVAPTPTTTAMMAPHGDLVVALKERNSSGQSGIAVLTAQGDKTEVVLMATPGKSKANHIHSGDCIALGGVVYSLTDMVNGQSTTIVNASLDALTKGGFAVNLHDPANPGVYTACGEIPAKGSYIMVALKEKGGSGQTGIASLVAKPDSTSTDVALYATAGVSQANHIHTGDCTTLGGVKNALTNMKDGVSVTSVPSKLADLAAGGHAINLHKADNPSVYTACGEIPKTAVASAATLTPTSGSGGSTGAPSTSVVQATIKSYTLPNLTVAVGTTITWTQTETEGHTVTSATAGLWDSGGLDKGKTFSYTFAKAGVYPYKCLFHSSMTATVTVTSPGPTPVVDTSY